MENIQLNNDKIAVLIPTMNRPKSLAKTLNAYISATILPDEIIVVDQSANKDVQKENKRLLLQIGGAITTIYHYQRIPSSTVARNTAMRLCHSEIVIFSDDDVEVRPETLLNIKTIMENNQVSMIAGVNKFAKTSTSKVGYFLGTKSFRNRHIGYITGSMLGRFPDKITEEVPTQWAMGFFFVVRKSLLNKWNLQWDEQLTGYAYAEDLDFTYSYYKYSQAENLKCIMSNRVVVKHFGSQEYRIPSREHVFKYIINRAYLNYKHHMGREAELMMWWCNFWMLVRSRIKKQNYKDYKDALCKLKKVDSYLRKGILKSSFYE